MGIKNTYLLSFKWHIENPYAEECLLFTFFV